MGTPIQNQANAVFNAVNEGIVLTVITLYDKHIILNGVDRRSEIRRILTDSMGMVEATADYWLDFFRVS